MSNQKEPIAIIGIGCRFPGGASNSRLFWRNLCLSKDAITDVPADRWDIRKFYDPDPDKPGKTYVKQGGFLKEKIDHFDPLFFGISPREAEAMDPQQRLLLEVTWEAMEDAGLPLDKLQGSRTGVFIGGFMLDNMLMSMGQLNRELVDNHTPTSSTMTILSNRLSYVFDLHGPSITIDTACSSSLVAAHYACMSIWSGESDMVITGGVNVMLRPEYPIAMSKGQFLSAHGRCMAFDERAAGYTRGEGAGIILLKPVSKAVQDQDHIYALIRMTGVNQDGRTPGISMPNADAQEQLIRTVYENAGISPGQVHYVEAHGTGTRAGDPKEAYALNKVLSQGRDRNNKCLVGSVKTNIGHLEAAAGIAGLIKASLCLHEEKIPPSLHFVQPNPDIPFADMCIRVPTRLEDWPAHDNPRLAGVNSFGYGGTNAHILLQQAPVIDEIHTDCQTPWNKPYLAPVSAHNENALKELAGKYAFHLSVNNSDKAAIDFLHTLSLRRTHHNHRISIVADSMDELRTSLESISAGAATGQISIDVRNDSDKKLVFVYAGMGPQWWGMGRMLLEQDHIFRSAVEECDRLFHQYSGWSIMQELLKDEHVSSISRTEIAQPANFVLQYALTKLLETYGITPDAVIGHSVGEVTSTCISGALTLPEAVKVSFHRSRLQATTAGKGSMLAAGITETEAVSKLRDFDRISIAAINGLSSLTLSGDQEQLAVISECLNRENIFNRFLEVEVAYHSPQMDTVRSELIKNLSSLVPSPSKLKLVSTVTGEFIDGCSINNNYWWNNVRQPVRFLQGINSLIGSGYVNFLEIAPHPVLSHYIRDIGVTVHKKLQVISTLNRKLSDYKSIYNALGELYCLGFDLNWSGLIPPGGKRTALPTYPWQRNYYWRESPASRKDRLGNSGHVMFDRILDGPGNQWSVEINSQYFPFLADHSVNSEVVFPGSAYVEAGLALHRKLFENRIVVITDLIFHNILLVDTKKNQELCIDHDSKSLVFNVYSRYLEYDAEWKKHASGRLIKSPYTTTSKTGQIDIDSLRRRIKNLYSVEKLYEDLHSRGLDYGYYFRNSGQLWVSDSEFLVHIECDGKFTSADNLYLLHPVILDCAFHSLLSIINNKKAYVPISIERVTLLKTPPANCWCHGVLVQQDEDTLIADFRIFDDKGILHVEIKSCLSKTLTAELGNKSQTPENYMYLPTWKAYENAEFGANVGNCLLFAGADDISSLIEDKLKSERAIITVIPGIMFRQLTDSCYELNPESKTDFESLLSATEASRYTHIFYLWPLLDNTGDTIINAINNRCMSLIYLVQACAKYDHELTLVVLTKGSQSVTNSESVINLNNSPFWGLLPLVENEFTNLHYKLVDLCPDMPVYDFNQWFDYIIDANITDLAIRDGKPYGKHLERFPVETPTGEINSMPAPATEPVELYQRKPGHVESLSYRICERTPPQANQVEIKVHYAGVNFKDVLKIYGTIDEQTVAGTYFGYLPGMEISGTVTALGGSVNGIKIGDEVIAAVSNGFRSYALADSDFVIKKPEVLKFEESLVHIVYGTAYYALIDIARLDKGEKILIHSAAGGLGLAAVQVAKMVGAEIYATASTDEKRQFLSSLGLNRVMDSRSLNFYDEIMEYTNGRGVDVVLNTLSGEPLIFSLNLLAPHGRFVEAGKSDIAANSNLPMLPFNRSISFSAVDFDRMHAEKPQLVSRLMKTVTDCFNNGLFKPLPLKIFKAGEFIDAIRFMAQGKHIGKIVIKYEGENVDVTAPPHKSMHWRPDGTYLIAGGTSGFGLAVAEWLADQGVGRLVLVSRSGAQSVDCKNLIKKIKRKGVEINVRSVDISSFTAVETLINKVQSEGPPLRGIFNSAMVLDDAFIRDMTSEQFMSVLTPKVAGTLNLYNCTRSMEIDFFVSFSSIASIVGNRGQANYVAANAFLDEFSYMARKNNFPAYTINWGVLAESGIVNRNRNLGELLEKEGIKGLGNNISFSAIEKILSGNHPQTGVFDVDWARWGKLNPTANSTRFRDLVKQYTDDAINTNIKHQLVMDIIRDMTDTEIVAYISDKLRDGMAKIIRLPPDRINLTQKLDSLGIDSLLLLELSVAIHDEFGIEMSVMDLFKQPTITSLADEVIRRLMLSARIDAAPSPA